MKKEIGLLVLMTTFLLSGCGSDKPASVEQGNTESSGTKVETHSTQDTNAKLLGSSEEEKVKLYSTINGVSLEFNGTKKEFAWNVPDTGTAPQVFYSDVTGDGKEEAIVVVQIGRGTGLNNYEIHVVNAGNLSEIKVQSYEKIVADLIETNLAKNDDGTLAISVKTQGKEYNFNYESDPAPDQKYNSLGFGGVFVYSLENQRIKLNLGAAVPGTTAYVCDFNIIYKFDSAKNEFVADEIEVVPIEK